MTQVVYRIRRGRCAIEPNGSHGVEIGGGSVASFTDIQFREDSFKFLPERPMETPMLIQQHIFGYPSKVFMPRKATVDISTNLRAAPARAGNATLMSNVPDANMWAVGFGGEFLGTGTTIASTSTVTVLNVTSAAGLREGSAIGCATGAGGALECREIKTIASNVVTLKLALSSVPTNGSQVYAAATYFLGATDGGNVRSLQWALEGATAADKWLVKGGQLNSPPKFTLAPGTIPKIDWSWKHAEWLRADGNNVTGFSSLVNLTGTAISDQAYLDTGINAVMDSELRIHTHGNSALAGTLVQAQQINIAPNIQYGPHTSPSGLNTVFQWVPLRPSGPACTGDIALPLEDTTWKDFRDNETQRALFYQIGSSVVNGAVLVSVPRIAFDGFALEEIDGISGQKIPFYAMLDNQTTGNTTDHARSVVRVHIF